MNDVQVDFTIPETSTEVDMSFADNFDTSMFAIKGDKGDAGQDGQDGTDGQDGKGIASITKSSTSGLVDTYTITYTDNTTSTFEVTNGQNGTNGQDGQDGTDGQDGRDGVIQYTAGDNITIENNVISATGGGANIYLGEIADYNSQVKALDITGLNGIYAIKIPYKNSSATLHLKFNYNETYVYGSLSFVQKYLSSQMLYLIVNIPSTLQSGDAIAQLIWTELGTTNEIVSTKTIKYTTSSLNLSSGTTNTFAWVATTTNQTIDGVKTFNSLPECTAVPTTDGQLVNKKYVDDNAGGSSIYLGKFSDFNSTSNYLDLSTLDVGTYRIIVDDTTNYLYFGTADTNKRNIYNPAKQGNGSYSSIVGDMYLIVYKKLSDISSDYDVLCDFYTFQFTWLLSQSWDNTLKLYRTRVQYFESSNQIYSSDYNYGYRCMGLDDAQTVTGLKTFTTLPQSSVVPTTDNQLVNKKYVDDQVGAINTVLATLTTPSGGE